MNNTDSTKGNSNYDYNNNKSIKEKIILINQSKFLLFKLRFHLKRVEKKQEKNQA